MKKIIMYLLIAFVAIQFIRPKKNKSDLISKNHLSQLVDMPQNVLDVYERSCNDCHSNHTNYTWYHEIAPISWVVAHHIKEGKEHFNIDEFATYNIRQQKHLMEDLSDVIKFDEMPIKGYVLFHPESALSTTEKTLLIDWAEKN